MPGNKMEMRVVEWKIEGSLKYTAGWGKRERVRNRETRIGNGNVERARQRVWVNITRAGKGEKDRKGQTVGEILQ